MEITVEERKRLGAYYTSRRVANFLAGVSVCTRQDRVLEPCFGGGVFLEAVWRRFLQLTPSGAYGEIVGIDSDPCVVREGERKFPYANLLCSNFFAVDPGAGWKFDVVIGNPPFIRYHRFRGHERELGLAQARKAGVVFPALASAWAPFLVHATRFLAVGGRMAVVAPMEMMYARYARPFVVHLCGNFERVRVLLFDEPLFPELNEATVLLVAGGWGGKTSKLELVYLKSEEDLDVVEMEGRSGVTVPVSHWDTGGISPHIHRLPEAVLELCNRLAERSVPLGELAALTIGYVTGANAWFHLGASDVEQRGLHRDVRFVLRKSGDLAGVGLGLTEYDRCCLGATGAHWLFYPTDPVGTEALAYIAEGEQQGISRQYKCRVRDPWWRVPGVDPHDFVVGVFSTGAPRIVAGPALATNSLLVGDLRSQDRVDAWTLAAAAWTSLAALTAEVAGHALGGGVLKLEPAEAKRWRLPMAFVPRAEVQRLDGLIRRGRLAEAQVLADELFLHKGLRIEEMEIEQIRRAVQVLREARLQGRDTRSKAVGSTVG